MTNECREFMKGKLNVCLQFPDEQLNSSTQIASELGNAYILADTTFGSCCIDKVAGEHGNAGGIIHFGPACLSKPSKNSPPIKWIFDVTPVDVTKVAAALKQIEGPVLVLTATETFHCLPALIESVTSPRVIFSSIHTEFDPLVTNVLMDGEMEVQGRTFKIPTGLELSDITLFYIGKESLTLTNIMMTLACAAMISFDPASSNVVDQRGQINTVFRRRYMMVQKAKDANVIGIVVGTLAVGKSKSW